MESKEELTNLCKSCIFLISEDNKTMCSTKKRVLEISDFYGLVVSINKCSYYKNEPIRIKKE